MPSLSSPDANAQGFLATAVDPLRYDGHTTDPSEAAGMIMQLTRPNARVLDIGCGTGSLSRLLIDQRGVSLLGLEPDAARADLARTRGVEVMVSTLDANSADTLGTFDQIIFADVLEHLPDPASILRLTAPLLNPQGEIIASVPNIAHWSVRWALLRGRFEYAPYGIMDATHLRWFTTHSIRQLFESSGYRVVSMQHTAGTGLPVYWERGLWRRVPRQLRNRLVRQLARQVPTLFGCQHVIRAVPRASSSTACP